MGPLQKGYHTLHIVCINGSLEILKLIWEKLQKEDISPDMINIRDWSGLTPLHYTCNEGWIDCTEFLLKNGADVNMVNEDAVCYIGGFNAPLFVTGGRTPLHLAAEKGEI